MATRKSGDESSEATARGGSPGSYAKVSGSRRKKKGRKQRGNAGRSSSSSIPPASTERSLSSADVTASGVRDAEASAMRSDAPERASEPRESESAGQLVDDLRSLQAASSRAPRRQVGPLGMHEGPEQAFGSASGGPHGRINVVEINAPGVSASASPAERAVQASADATATHADERSGEPAHPAPVAPDDDHQPDPDGALDFYAPTGSFEHAAAEPFGTRHSLSAFQEGAHGAELATRHSFSSVLEARHSFQPSSAPASADNGARWWWLAVSVLCAIIGAAGVVAVREALRGPRPMADQAPAGLAEPAAGRSEAAPSAAAPTVSTPPASVELEVPAASLPAAPASRGQAGLTSPGARPADALGATGSMPSAPEGKAAKPGVPGQPALGTAPKAPVGAARPPLPRKPSAVPAAPAAPPASAATELPSNPYDDP